MLALPLERYGVTQDRSDRRTKSNLHRAWKLVETADISKAPISPSAVKNTDYRETLSVFREGFPPVRAEISQNDVLPEEIKDSIVGEYGLTEDDWYNLSFIRPFHHAAMRLLYQKVNCHRESLVSRTRTFLEREDLAALVETLDIEEGRSDWRPKDADYLVTYRYMKAKGFTTRSKDEWMEGIKETYAKNEAILTTLFVLSVPKVSYLSISEKMLLGVPYREPGSMGNLSFDQLSKVRISGAASSVSELAPLFRLPSLLTLVANGFEEVHCCERIWKPDGFSMTHDSTIKVLELCGNKLHLDSLTTILLTCKALQAFSFDFCPMVSWDYHEKVEFPSVKEALEPFQDTLTSLSLDQSKASFTVDDWKTFTVTPWQPLGSLTEFSNLEYIRLDIEALYGSNTMQWQPLFKLLPSSIKGIDLAILAPGPRNYPMDDLVLHFFMEDIVLDPTVLPNLRVFATSKIRRSNVARLQARGVEVHKCHPICYIVCEETQTWTEWDEELWKIRRRMSDLIGLT